MRRSQLNLNAYFLPIKVDKEEHPDSDSIYSVLTKSPRACPSLLQALDWVTHPILIRTTPSQIAHLQKRYLPTAVLKNEETLSSGAVAMLCQGLKCLAPAKTTIPEATLPETALPIETTIPSETAPTEEKINTPPTATEQTTSPQKGQPQSVDKCFELFAYDPEDNTVNVRDSPDGNIIETLPNLSIVQSEGPTAIQTGWNSISVAKTGTQGYIWGELLYRTTYQVSDPEDPTANLRQTANGALITAIANGTEVEFLGTDGSWTQVALSNGQSGYITSSRLSEPNCF